MRAYYETEELAYASMRAHVRAYYETEELAYARALAHVRDNYFLPSQYPPNIMQVLIEAAICGVIIVVSLMLVVLVYDKALGQHFDILDSTQGKLAVFFAGALAHLGCEVTGLNRLYCTSGASAPW